jgi:hypothetical protein
MYRRQSQTIGSSQTAAEHECEIDPRKTVSSGRDSLLGANSSPTSMLWERARR